MNVRIFQDGELETTLANQEFMVANSHAEQFFKTLTGHDYEEGEVTCPHCGSDRVELRVTLPDAATKKSS